MHKLLLISKFSLVLAPFLRSVSDSSLNPSATLRKLPSRIMPSLPWHGCQKMRHRHILSPSKRQVIWRIWLPSWPAAKRPLRMHTTSYTVRTPDSLWPLSQINDRWHPWLAHGTLVGYCAMCTFCCVPKPMTVICGISKPVSIHWFWNATDDSLFWNAKEDVLWPTRHVGEKLQNDILTWYCISKK